MQKQKAGSRFEAHARDPVSLRKMPGIAAGMQNASVLEPARVSLIQNCRPERKK